MESLVSSFSKLFVPEEILCHFEVKNLQEESGVILIELTEKDDVSHIPKEIVRQGKAVKDGYMNSIDIQSFPAQGKEVFLRIKRRRWKIKGTTKGYHNTYNFINIGIKCTKEFGAFLKEIGRE
jgi:phosphoribosyl-AMP cyclohydrolase